ncbi:MAG: signal recognition particle protein [Thermoprotei archaeon]|nr:MAG: signal recognition particle protein [Thermoprotei archaeon]
MTLASLREGLSKAIAKIRRAPYVDERLVKEVIRDIQRALLKADVDVRLVLSLSRTLERRLREEQPPPGFTRRDLALKVVYEELLRLLGGGGRFELAITKRPYVIMLVGIQGSGKTTSAAKLAYYLKRRGYRVGLVCADNFRPGAAEQLRQLGEKVGVPVCAPLDVPSAVEMARRGVERLVREGCDVIIIDTAGRHKEESSLLKEMREMANAIRPDEIMLVLDATMGKTAGAHARAFHEATPIGSIFLTKLDGAARGGGALAAIQSTGAKVKFIGDGEGVEDIEEFDPQSFVSRLLGMGDLRALIERFREHEEASRELARVLASGKMTLLDFKRQLEAISKLGPLSRILEFVPGFAGLPEGADELSREKIKRWLAAMNSMTMEELLDPGLINRSRMRRVARGAGVTVRDVRELLATYKMLRRQMKRLSRRLGRSMALRGLRGGAA